ncbi:MAG TPA: OmpA family protein [Clostridia bacterium]|nr:OmpA family protein [Clostridia bacterium]
MNKIKNRGLLWGPFFCGLTALFLLLSTSPLIQAEELYIDAFQPAAQYAHTERENVRVYQGNSYQGLQYRGRRVYLQRSAGSATSASATTGTADSAGALYRGSVYLIKTLTRDTLRVLQPVDREISISCRVSAKGFVPVKGSELPIRTGFPVIPEGDIAPGDTWKADGRDAVYLEDGTLIPAPFHSGFSYRGRMQYMDRPAHVIDFSYTHYDHSPYTNDSTEIRGHATGEIALFIDGDDGAGGYFISERLTRHYLEYGTPAKREEGFRLTWGRGVSLGEIESLERTMIAALQEEQENSEVQDDQEDLKVAEKGEGVPGKGEEEDQQIQIERSTEGITLNLPRIHFYPDQARILPREKQRLDKLAALLNKVPEATIMVKGHTANVGSKESQYKLSVERAQTIIDQMVERGLAPSRFVYQGIGGDEPVAPNDTEEGRAQNRRVEVIILNK